MDPLFERRTFIKKVHIHSKFIQRNIQASLLNQLKILYEGKCLSEGYIERNSATILDYSLGRANFVKGGVDYDVVFQADVCFPHPGQQFRGQVALRSKIGIHIETPPIKVLIPRDTHMGQAEFDLVKEGEDIVFEVVGSQFKQNDDSIIVVGKLLPASVKEVEPIVASIDNSTVIQQTEAGEVKQISYNMGAEQKKTRKLRRNINGEELLHDSQKRADEGTA